MATHPEHPVTRFVRSFPTLRPDATDAELVDRFVSSGDEAAFAALVERYASMVFGVCRRVAGHDQDAEDAFQVTFLVLARRASGLREPAAVGNWLYGVAVRAAWKARSARLRHDTLARRSAARSPSHEPSDDRLAELDRAVAALPEKYRLPVVMCELQGRSRKQAAEQLGLAEGTLSSRLAAARRMLARRIGRAVVFPTVAVAADARPAVARVRTAAWADPTAPLDPAVHRLMKGVLFDMTITRWKLPLTLFATVAVLATGAAVALQPPPPRQSATGSTDQPAVVPEATALTPLLTFTGSDSGVTEVEFVRVSDPAEWRAVWLRHQGLTENDAWTSLRPMLEVDFDRCEVIALFRGKGTNRRGIWVKSITESADKILLRYADATFQTSGGAAATTPYGFLLLPASGKPIVIERDTQSLKDRPPVWIEEARLNSTKPAKDPASRRK